MPIYTFKCIDCKDTREHTMSITDHTTFSRICTQCDGNLEQIIDAPPNFCIGSRHTFDGKTKISNKSLAKQQPRVPINIIDQKPDGSFRVTRAGSKKDINNE